MHEKKTLCLSFSNGVKDRGVGECHTVKDSYMPLNIQSAIDADFFFLFCCQNHVALSCKKTFRKEKKMGGEESIFCTSVKMTNRMEDLLALLKRNIQ